MSSLRSVVVEQPRSRDSRGESEGLRRRRGGGEGGTRRKMPEEESERRIQAILKGDNREIKDILEENKATVPRKEEEEVGENEQFGSDNRWWGWCCTDLNKPWPPMWRPQAVAVGAEEDDEELDVAMMALHKPVSELEDKGRSNTVLEDIWRCFTTVRDH